jgi:hypothetical protein
MEVQTMSNPQANMVPANIGPTGSKHLNNTSRAGCVESAEGKVSSRSDGRTVRRDYAPSGGDRAKVTTKGDHCTTGRD